MIKTFPLRAVLGIITARSWGGSFGDVHECAEHVMGHPVWTHEFASEPLWAEMRRRVLAVRADLADITEEQIPSSKENLTARMDAAIARFGATVDLPSGDAVRTKSPMETLAEIAPGKPTITVAL